MSPDKNKFRWKKSAPGEVGISETRKATVCPLKDYREGRRV